MSELTERIERALYEMMEDKPPPYGPYDNYSVLYKEKARKQAPRIEAALRAAATGEYGDTSLLAGIEALEARDEDS
jgi:hypothetical protein